MIELVFAFVAWMTPPSDVAALRRTASLTDDAAAENIAAARIAGVAYELDPDLLLAIAWRESRYRSGVIGPLVRGKRACGVMQPIMRTTCGPPSSLLDGYLEGAAHLREWIRSTRSQRDALVGYAGGHALIERCRIGPVEVKRAAGRVDLCTTPELRRAAWIRRERSRRSTAARSLW